MDFTQIQDVIGWVIGLFASSIIAIVVGIISIIKSGRMLPKDLRKADLENKDKEVSIADQLDEIATRAADRALKTQERLDNLEVDYLVLKNRVTEQDQIIREQAKIIKEQSERLKSLSDELCNTQAYNSALIKQMHNANMIPVEMINVNKKLHGLDKKQNNESV